MKDEILGWGGLKGACTVHESAQLDTKKANEKFINDIFLNLFYRIYYISVGHVFTCDKIKIGFKKYLYFTNNL